MILADEGGLIKMTNLSVYGGFVEVSSTGKLQFDNAVLANAISGTGHITTTNHGGGMIFTTEGTHANQIAGTFVNMPGGMVNIVGGSDLAMKAGGDYTNNSTIMLEGVLGMPAKLVISSAGFEDEVTLKGSGLVTMFNDINNIITGRTGFERLINENDIIGGGQIGMAKLALTNRETITATSTMIIAPSDGGVLNTGLIEASNGPLILQSGIFTNSETIGGFVVHDGTIQANAGGTVMVNDSAIAGGIIKIFGGGTLTLNDSTIAGCLPPTIRFSAACLVIPTRSASWPARRCTSPISLWTTIWTTRWPRVFSRKES
jgi:hypothetical protein